MTATAWWQNVLEGTAHAPWLWWAITLVVLLAVLLLLLKAMGLLPE